MRYFILCLAIIIGLLSGGIAVADYQKTTEFESLDELQVFLKTDNTDHHIVFKCGKDGKVSFNNQCEDYAIQLRNRAQTIGKHIEVIPIDYSEYRKWNSKFEVKLRYGQYHMINMAIIGNDCYYIEPQTDNTWMALHLD